MARQWQTFTGGNMTHVHIAQPTHSTNHTQIIQQTTPATHNALAQPATLAVQHMSSAESSNTHVKSDRLSRWGAQAALCPCCILHQQRQRQVPTNTAHSRGNNLLFESLLLCRSERTLKLLQDHIQAITSRVNTITGVAYKNDPTIIGYNLFNEPRWGAKPLWQTLAASCTVPQAASGAQLAACVAQGPSLELLLKHSHACVLLSM
jgi:hypothetical protein